MQLSESKLETLKASLEGEIHWDPLHKAIYATDASVYREIPTAVIHPKNESDIIKVVRFANENKIGIIPRTAGTSLAGQCVGSGLVLDVSRFMNEIYEIDDAHKTVRLQPGVVRDKLNQTLLSHGLFFPPETSTANRAMIGGMIGNNSCGANSIVYGSTRDYVTELRMVLSDGSVETFFAQDKNEWKYMNPFAHAACHHLVSELSNEDTRNEIVNEFPKPSVHRRNTGYSVDLVLNELNKGKFDLIKLFAGSEGTLGIITEAKLRLVETPGKESIMFLPHFHSIHESMQAVVTVMRHKPYTCELMDRVILTCTDGHEVFKKYKYFVEGDPAALLMIEFRNNDRSIVEQQINEVVADLQANQLGYAYPVIKDPVAIKNIWEMRRAGLGLLGNMEGEAKAIECIEDTAVAIEDLPDYIREFAAMMDSYQQSPLYYAHAGAGELHLRPVLNMHDPADRKTFRMICEDSARLVKKYKGSLSGEHGDGRLRGELIPLVLGEKNYQLLKRIKHTWDPHNILNPGKIVEAPPLDQDLRHIHENSDLERRHSNEETMFDFSKWGGHYHAAARCTGSADCRKQSSMGGTMCPTFMASKNEKDSTRARANALREFYSRPDLTSLQDMNEVKSILDLCISCKGCHNECPSNVDMTILKSEFLHEYYRRKGKNLRTTLLEKIDTLNDLGASFPSAFNILQNNIVTKSIIGIHPKRKMPDLYKFTFKSWTKSFKSDVSALKKPVLFFIDEFSNHYDVEIAMTAVKLLDKLGHPVRFTDHAPSGRAQYSKGLLPLARKYAIQNVHALYPFINDHVLVGVEPSAILSFRDEYPLILKGKDLEKALAIKPLTFTIEEFLYNESKIGNIDSSRFDTAPRKILIHGHCHQKALTDVSHLSYVLGLPANHTVSTIPSGCCGMAGSFGYEKEHYDMSMQIGELVLFPTIRKSNEQVLIAASGTSCRHQIKDGTSRKAFHPVEILWMSLNERKADT